MTPPPWKSVCALLLLTACARTPDDAAPARDAHDVQVPATEPREEITVTMDLPARSDCEEAFDLALYRNSGIDLVEWDRATGCIQRRAKIRYVTTRIARDAVVARIRGLTTKMEIVSP